MTIDDSESSVLRGSDLRAVLTRHLTIFGPATVGELADAVAELGFDVAGRPSKVVSDALRWEVRHGRVMRRRYGRYAALPIARSTEYKIIARSRDARAKLATLGLCAGEEEASLDFLPRDFG